MTIDKAEQSTATWVCPDCGARGTDGGHKAGCGRPGYPFDDICAAARQSAKSNQERRVTTDKEMLDLLTEAWGVIGSADGGDWSNETADWHHAAAAFRRKWLHLFSHGEPRDQPPDETLAEVTKQRNKLQAFKDWVHAYLDKEEVPADPHPDQTAATGCRISGRMDWWKEAFAKADKQRDEALRELDAAKARARYLEERLDTTSGLNAQLRAMDQSVSKTVVTTKGTPQPLCVTGDLTKLTERVAELEHTVSILRTHTDSLHVDRNEHRKRLGLVETRQDNLDKTTKSNWDAYYGLRQRVEWHDRQIGKVEEENRRLAGKLLGAGAPPGAVSDPDAGGPAFDRGGAIAFLARNSLSLSRSELEGWSDAELRGAVATYSQYKAGPPRD